MKKYLPKLTLVAKQAGFTMIELLIVISILGILAVAVLSAINPIEQINRGKDTGSQSDAEQLISAIDRYYASNGTYPWQGTESNAATSYPAGYYIEGGALDGTPALVTINGTETAANIPTYYDDTVSVLDELKNADEIKNSFVERVENATNPLSIYYDGTPGDSVYICFNPKSKDFRKKAGARCGAVSEDGGTGVGLPADLSDIASTICPAAGAGEEYPGNPPNTVYTCLP